MKFTVNKKDFEVTWFSGKGGGGQHRNRHMNCCRLKHKATGIIATGQSNKERLANQKEAFHKIVKNPFFLAYCDRKLRELEGEETKEQWVERQMQNDKFTIQGLDENGNWVNL